MKDKVKLTISIPTGKYCDDCPCLGLNGNETEHCGYFDKSLDCEGTNAIKCGECMLMVKMLLNENEGTKTLLSHTRDIPIDRLEEICNAERDGRCVVLPCKEENNG